MNEPNNHIKYNELEGKSSPKSSIPLKNSSIISNTNIRHHSLISEDQYLPNNDPVLNQSLNQSRSSSSSPNNTNHNNTNNNNHNNNNSNNTNSSTPLSLVLPRPSSHNPLTPIQRPNAILFSPLVTCLNPEYSSWAYQIHVAVSEPLSESYYRRKDRRSKVDFPPVYFSLVPGVSLRSLHKLSSVTIDYRFISRVLLKDFNSQPEFAQQWWDANSEDLGSIDMGFYPSKHVAYYLKSGRPLTDLVCASTSFSRASTSLVIGIFSPDPISPKIIALFASPTSFSIRGGSRPLAPRPSLLKQKQEYAAKQVAKLAAGKSIIKPSSKLSTKKQDAKEKAKMKPEQHQHQHPHPHPHHQQLQQQQQQQQQQSHGFYPPTQPHSYIPPFQEHPHSHLYPHPQAHPHPYAQAHPLHSHHPIHSHPHHPPPPSYPHVQAHSQSPYQQHPSTSASKPPHPHSEIQRLHTPAPTTPPPNHDSKMNSTADDRSEIEAAAVLSGFSAPKGKRKRDESSSPSPSSASKAQKLDHKSIRFTRLDFDKVFPMKALDDPSSTSLDIRIHHPYHLADLEAKLQDTFHFSLGQQVMRLVFENPPQWLLGLPSVKIPSNWTEDYSSSPNECLIQAPGIMRLVENPPRRIEGAKFKLTKRSASIQKGINLLCSLRPHEGQLAELPNHTLVISEPLLHQEVLYRYDPSTKLDEPVLVHTYLSAPDSCSDLLKPVTDALLSYNKEFIYANKPQPLPALSPVPEMYVQPAIDFQLKLSKFASKITLIPTTKPLDSLPNYAARWEYH